MKMKKMKMQEKMEEVLLDQEGEGRRGEEESSDGRQSPPKSFCCEHCGRTFQHPSTLKRHVDCHLLPFLCVFCPDAFSRRGYLRIHLSKYHSVKNVDLHRYVPFSHLKYSDEEEVNLVRSIADKNAYERMNQSELWKALEEEKVLENRTARGMHSHFERDILPNIKTGKKSYGLTEKELSLFKKWGRKKKDVVEEEKIRKAQEKKDREEVIVVNVQTIYSSDSLKQHIKQHRLGLIFRDCTRGDGNCWYRACVDQVVLYNLAGLPTDHRALRLLIISRIRSLPQYEGWLLNHFGGNEADFNQFLNYHSQDGIWTDDCGFMCQATALILQHRIMVVGTNNDGGYFMLESVLGSENSAVFTIGYDYDARHYQSLTTPFLEEKIKKEGKEGDEKSKGNLQFDYGESSYFRELTTAIATPEEMSVELFQNSLDGLAGWKMRTAVVNKKKGTTQQNHYPSPDGYVLKTGRGVLEYLWLGGKLSQEAIVNIGKDVLRISDKKINGWLNNRIEEVDLTTFDDVDEDEVGFLEEVQVKEETDLASNQDEAAKEEDEEKEPNAQDESLSAEERGDEINLGKEGGLPLGFT